MRDGSPFVREPVDRAYRIIALAAGLHNLAESIEGDAEGDDRVMAIRHISETVREEATALVGQLEDAESAATTARTAGNES